MRTLLVLAVLPAAVLLIYVYQKDPTEKEPGMLLLKLLGFGVLSTIPAIFLEQAGTSVYLDAWDGTKLGYLVFDNFVVVALVEEGCKFFFLWWATWNDRNFDFVFDGIVYAVFVGLGFAIAENINYVFSYGFETGVVRAFTAIPGHCVFAVFMGFFYGHAKYQQSQGHGFRKCCLIVLAWGVPMLLHGCYDSLASLEGDAATLAFFAYLIAIVFVGWRLIKRESANIKHIR